jgi:hypothetical protein
VGAAIGGTGDGVAEGKARVGGDAMGAHVAGSMAVAVGRARVAVGAEFAPLTGRAKSALLPANKRTKAAKNVPPNLNCRR